MNRIWPAFLALLLSSCSSALDFTLKDVDGNSVTLSSFRGKAVVLNFWFLA